MTVDIIDYWLRAQQITEVYRPNVAQASSSAELAPAPLFDVRIGSGEERCYWGQHCGWRVIAPCDWSPSGRLSKGRQRAHRL